MKKNFLKIAALLIAAMLLVVSCSQEVKAPENDDNGPVAVTLNTSVASKGLTFEGLESVEDVVYTYTLDALWDDTNLDEKIVGEKSDITISNINNSIDLGYLSQGYWKIIVKGTHTVTNKVVLYGETNQYITKGKGAVTVFLNVAGDDNNDTGSILTFNIDVNNLAAGNNGYTLHYTIDGADYKGTAITTKSGEISKFSNENNITKFKGSTPDDDKLQPGYYRVTVTLKKDTSVIGAITRGFLLIDGDEAVTIKGSVSARDFEKSSLTVLNPKLNLTVTAQVGENGDNLLTENPTLQEDKNLKKGVYEIQTTSQTTSKSVDITYKVSAEVVGIDHTSLPTGVTFKGPTYKWIADGVEVSTSETYEPTYVPGYKYVTCIVTYTYEYNNGISSAEYPISAEAYTYLLVK